MKFSTEEPTLTVSISIVRSGRQECLHISIHIRRALFNSIAKSKNILFFSNCFFPPPPPPPPGQEAAVQGEDWVNWRDGEFSYKFVPRDPGYTAVQQCWNLGYGAYPLSIVDVAELEFIVNTLGGKIRQCIQQYTRR